MGGLERRSPAAVRLRLLGGFRCEVRGEPWPLPLACQRIVAFLAVHDGPVQRTFVAGNLWLDKDEARATANLRSGLWRLGKMSEPVVVAESSSLSLHDGVAIDTHELAETAYRIAEERRAGGAATGAPGGRAGAGGAGGLALPEPAMFDRDLLPDWYDEWLVLERERVRQLRLHALDMLSEALLSEGRIAMAIDAACASVASEPLRESAHRALIRAHLAAGNRAEAIRQYRRFEALLEDAMGLRPSESLANLASSPARV